MNEKLILVTNDDGITSKGIRALIEAAKQFGKVVVVAPDKSQSAMGHAITIHNPLRVHKVDIFDDVEVAYACSGTPVDCVKLALAELLDQKPDLCVSGINHGTNASINVIYSGTMSAAMEAAMEGIPSIGFSLCNFSRSADMSASQKYAIHIIQQVLEHGITPHNLLNVNIPDLPFEAIKGIKICQQGKAHWEEEYYNRLDPMGRRYYWLTGKFVWEDEHKNSDVYALENDYVSIVPVQFDLTDYKGLDFLTQNWINI